MRFCSEEQLGQAQAGPIIYCDGAGAGGFRQGIDLELSHWVPNRTPKQFAADTSTEICMEFAATGGEFDAYDLVVNNHVDVDGILSVFTILEPDLALRHRDTIVQAAEMGDFWGWGEAPAQELFQALTIDIVRGVEAGNDTDAFYHSGFDTIHSVLSGQNHPEVRAGLDALSTCVDRIRQGELHRTLVHARFAHYAIPRSLADVDLGAALRVMPFNTPMGDDFTLLPHARARLDRERVTLQSVECAEGWYYDLSYPAYCWADTPRSWRPPGLRAPDPNRHILDWPLLQEAVAELAVESANGAWACAKDLSPFHSLEGRGFPVILSFMDQDRPAVSRIPPEVVAERLAEAFE